MHRFLNIIGLVVILSGCAWLKSTPDENKRLDAFFEEKFNFWLNRSPEWQTYMGLKTNYGQLDELSDARDLEDFELTKKFFAEFRQFDVSKLDATHRLSYRIWEQRNLNEIEDFKYRYHYYPVNQMFGVQSDLPSFMINMHRVDSKSDAEAYISRLNGFKKKFSQVVERLEASAKIGVIPPKFVFPKVIEDSRNVISGQPFDESSKLSPLLEDFEKKVKALKVKDSEKQKLIAEAKEALKTSVGPGYQHLIAYMQKLEKKADDRAGVWKFPDGENYYKNRLKRITTTDMTPQQIHNLGLKEVTRIHREMKFIMKKVEFKGSFPQFFEFMKKDPQFFYPDSQEGRAAYLKDTEKLIAEMKKQLPTFFTTVPKADLVVKPVEAYREKSAGTAFYQGPPLVGDRPGIYYVNLYDIKTVSKFEMEALAYHEALPGHHMQISLAKEQEDLPKFRRFGGFTAYVEGWGLYAEYLPKEYGFYQDPYSDFGRLSMELWRACRLVVDTGLHYKKWTRERAIAYLDKNTPIPHADNVKAIERYIVMPGQATAYKVGMLKILELREQAKAQLKDKFDIRQFHDVVLQQGSLPLNLLEENVTAWIKKSKAL